MFSHLFELLKLHCSEASTANDSSKFSPLSLVEEFLVSEGDVNSVLFHTMKLLHLVEISSLHLLLDNHLRAASAEQLVRFTCYVLNIKIFTVVGRSSSRTTIGTPEKRLITRFKETLFEAIPHVF